MHLNQQLGRDNTYNDSTATAGGTCNRVLVATTEELDIIQTALSLYRSMLQENARTKCTGYSEDAIHVCVRRMCVENLLQAIDPHTLFSRNSSPSKTVPGIPHRATA